MTPTTNGAWSCWSGTPARLMVPAPVLTEVCWLLERERGSKAEASFLDALAALMSQSA